MSKYISKQNIYVTALFSAVFFTFSGFYVLLILCTNLIGYQYSRFITIPIRILIILSLFTCLQSGGLKRQIDERILCSFIIFSFFYILRIMVDMLNNVVYYQGTTTFLIYYLGLAFCPFCLLLIKKEHPIDQQLYKLAILVSSVVFCLLTIFFYREYIGTVGRISLSLSRQNESYISPLALSDCSALSIGVALFILLTNPTRKLHKIMLICIILLSCVPFFLGAGRSSILGLILPFLFFMVFQKDKVQSIKILIYLIGFGFVFFILSEYFGSSVIDRFLSIDSDIEKGSSAAVRTEIWKYGLNHFYDNPIFGNGLEVREWGHHAHNIFIEVLLATGFLGFFPFLYLVFRGYKGAIHIIRHKPEASWIVVVFIHSFVITLFHGTVYSGAWFWFSLAFILSMQYKSDYVPRTISKKYVSN